jgi:hypothetical protein
MAEPISTSDQSITQPPQVPPPRIPTRAERVEAAMGKFAWIPFSSDDHIRRKQEEIKLEERQR